MIIAPEQCRAARALLGWSRDELAAAAKVAVRTLVDFERGARRPHDRTLVDIKRALEQGGIILIPPEDEGPGVRLRRTRPSSPATE